MIPIVNFILFLFLIFKTGQQENNKFGDPDTYQLPEGLRFLSYPIVILSFLIMPVFFIAINTLGTQGVHSVIDRLPSSIQQKVTSRGSLALVSINNKIVAHGVFITKQRILIRDVLKSNSLKEALSSGRFIIHVTNVKTEQTRLSRLVVANNSLKVKMAVFEVKKPIGKSIATLSEEEKSLLQNMKAFE